MGIVHFKAVSTKWYCTLHNGYHIIKTVHFTKVTHNGNFTLHNGYHTMETVHFAMDTTQ